MRAGQSMFDLTGKVAMVTGGNGGIGLGIAQGLARSGADIVVAARKRDKTARAVELLSSLGVRAIGASVDVAEEASVTAAIALAAEQLGRVDILVNNAGIGIRRQPQEFTAEEWDDVVQVNLKGAFLCSKPESTEGHRWTA